MSSLYNCDETVAMDKQQLDTLTQRLLGYSDLMLLFIASVEQLAIINRSLINQYYPKAPIRCFRDNYPDTSETISKTGLLQPITLALQTVLAMHNKKLKLVLIVLREGTRPVPTIFLPFHASRL